MSDFTLLTERQLFGDTKLEIFEKRGVTANITDFALLLGGIYGEGEFGKKTGSYWTKSEGEAYFKNRATVVTNMGFQTMDPLYICHNGIRPVIPIPKGTSGILKRADDGIFEVEYGYCPSKVVYDQAFLGFLCESGKIKETGRYYSIFNMNTSSAQHIKEYEYNGQRFIRVEAKLRPAMDSSVPLLNGKSYKRGESVWVEVLPIEWLVDKKSELMVAKNIIYAGFPFDLIIKQYYEEMFENTLIKKFMDEYLSKQIIQDEKFKSVSEYENSLRRKSRLEKLNPDKTSPKDRVQMTDTELIHNWIESGESVLLRGPSGIGKTERIRALYPDVIELKLTNNMFPEKVVGSVNLQTGQSIPPDFAKIAIMQGATEEEKKLIEENIQNIYEIADKVYERAKVTDKKVVIMLDELLNVNQHVQSLVYTLVLNRFVEIGKGIKLPPNVVLVGTGNQQKYSSAAYEMAEPLEKRFDHILDMEPKVGEWIQEYAIPQKIHPAVIGYMLSKYNNSGRSEEIEDIGYFYEEPEVGEEHLDKNGCKGRTNDPRGWTSISRALYNFEENLRNEKYEGLDVEDILLRTIVTKLREEWASEFYDFYNLPTLTPEEVVQGMKTEAGQEEYGYTGEDLPQDINERFAYMAALVTADESQVEACREFIRKYCDPEYLAIYEIYWAGKDERKQEKIAELQEMDLIAHSGQEAEKFGQDGAKAYSEIGQMYSNYLDKNKDKER